MKRLDSKTHAEIEKFCEKGEFFLNMADLSSALKNYWEAYDLLPEPKKEWVAGTWILAAIGDANFLKKDYQTAVENISVAMNYFPGAFENPFLHLRLGQCFFEMGNFEKATHEFLRVYAFEGEELFALEDAKYFGLIKSKLASGKMLV